MAFTREVYRHNTGCYCEKCRAIDNVVRLVQLEGNNGYSAYLCTRCMRDILIHMEFRLVGNPSTFAYTRDQLIQRVDPASRKTTLTAENLREVIGGWDADLKTMLKDFLDYKKGYTDRTVFWKDLRKHVKRLYEVFDQYLQKTP